MWFQVQQLEASDSVDSVQLAPSNSIVWEDPDRTFFRLSLKMGEVKLDLNYEDAADSYLAFGVFENFTFDLDVNPSNIALKSALGNVRIFDATMPENHPYRQVCGLKAGTSTSLVQVEFASHTPTESMLEERVPSGKYYYTFRARISALEVVFCYRFLNELLMYLWGK